MTMCNFVRNYYEEYLYEIILNLEILFKRFFIFSCGDHFVQLLDGIIGNISMKLI